ncbi:peptidoglycan-binding protein LysM [Streptomyces sp. NPDC049879]|uniref:peptidoglycan-binding protein LysM n=1 Tax=Streptomyces sp. NPDC049879 TaxID=3365598 RepID=UPI0037A09F38
MSLFSFVKEAGDNVAALSDSDFEARLIKHIEGVGLGTPSISAQAEGDKVLLRGEVNSQEEKEKLLLATGNIQGVASVEDLITLSGPAAQASRLVTVNEGDTLSSISRAVYGDPNRYNKIFEANRPLLKHPEKIYQGQVLRIVD